MAELRDLPGVDALLQSAELSDLVSAHGVQAVRDAVRDLQNNMRTSRTVPDWATEAHGYAVALHEALWSERYTPVFNLTGTVIHTNLGRSLLSAELWHDVAPLVTRPMNLEYSLAAGARGDRDGIIEERLKRLTGCEAATVVNNNAAALMLVLNTFGLGKPVPVSRGELIEIGGSFRLPELMTRSGAELVEVGTTNRTHVKDFAAVVEDAAMLLKVHPSNYHISGYSKEVTAAELAALAQAQGIPSCVDLGSGTLVDLTRWGLPAEPTPQSVLGDGIDLVTFSGDKLLGGVQAGIIVGRADLLAQIKKNPMKRALRGDKITLAVLDATLKRYETPDELPEHIPLLRTLTLSQAQLRARAESLRESFDAAWQTDIVDCHGQIGSGALPDKTIDSVALTLTHNTLNPDEVCAALRKLATPVIARVADDRVWLDMRGAEPLDELSALLTGLSA